MNTRYKIIYHDWQLKDQDSVRFHVKADDYFGTLATILSLWQQNKSWPQEDYQELYNDLEDLQHHYRIIQKSNKKKNG